MLVVRRSFSRPRSSSLPARRSRRQKWKAGKTNRSPAKTRSLKIASRLFAPQKLFLRKHPARIAQDVPKARRSSRFDKCIRTKFRVRPLPAKQRLHCRFHSILKQKEQSAAG